MTETTGPAPLPPRARGRRRLYVEDVAAAAGVTPRTIRGYNSEAKRARAQGRDVPHLLPEPTGHEQRRHGPPSPWWTESRIAAWLPNRRLPGWQHPAKDTGAPHAVPLPAEITHENSGARHAAYG